MATPSIHLDRRPQVQYLLRIGDTCLIQAQRLCEWSGHAPIIEEDIALSNMGLDLIGQARALLTHAGRIEGRGHDEDQLAFLRDERDYFNPTIAELPRGDFAFTVVRNAMLSTWLKALWRALLESTDPELAAIAGKAIKEARYHQRHAADWLERLGGGTTESRRRTLEALDTLWRYRAELFEDDDIDAQAQASGFGPAASALRADWDAEMAEILAGASLAAPGDSAFRSTGRQGIHSEHMGHLLAEMQYLQRAYPGGAW